jgi:predicted ABC-type ATPase
MRQLFIIAGANGAGKTTFADEFLLLHNDFVFINADNIAKELTPANADISSVRLSAGKKMLKKFRKAFEDKQSIIWESTLSGRLSFRKVADAKKNGYRVTLIYIFIDNPKICIDRVNTRILKGGHGIPEEDILRRYERSRGNFFTYIKLVDDWMLYCNEIDNVILVANNDKIINSNMYSKFRGDYV